MSAYLVQLEKTALVAEVLRHWPGPMDASRKERVSQFIASSLDIFQGTPVIHSPVLIGEVLRDAPRLASALRDYQLRVSSVQRWAGALEGAGGLVDERKLKSLLG